MGLGQAHDATIAGEADFTLTDHGRGERAGFEQASAVEPDVQTLCR